MQENLNYNIIFWKPTFIHNFSTLRGGANLVLQQRTMKEWTNMRV